MSNFNIGDPLDLGTDFSLQQRDEFEDDDFWNIDFDLLDVPLDDAKTAASWVREEMNNALGLDEPHKIIEIQSTHSSKSNRFKSLSEEDLKGIEDTRQSKSTKQNTKWGVNLFQG